MDALNVPATMLANAVQILLFAPLRHNPHADPIFVAGPKPEKRYPTRGCPTQMPATAEEGEQQGEQSASPPEPRLYADRFTLDDINRSLVLFRICIERRKNKGDKRNSVLNKSKPPTPGVPPQWLGYYKPDGNVALEDPFHVFPNALCASVEREITARLALHGRWINLPGGGQGAEGHGTAEGHGARQHDGEDHDAIDSDTDDDAGGFSYHNAAKADRQQEEFHRVAGSTLTALQMSTRIDIWTALLETFSSEEPGSRLRDFFQRFPVPDLPGITVKALKAIVAEASSRHAQTRPAEVSARSRERATSFAELVDVEDLAAYMEQSSNHPVIVNILDREPEKRDRYLEAIRTDFIMTTVMNSLAGTSRPLFHTISENLELNAWPYNDLWKDREVGPTLYFNNFQFAGESTMPSDPDTIT
jgi:uncharacterized protein YceH (UPF0502 family)